jgi:hypothetical protein
MLRPNPAIRADATSLLAAREASLIRMVRAARQRMLNRFLTTPPPTGRVSYGSLRVATAVRRSAECQGSSQSIQFRPHPFIANYLIRFLSDPIAVRRFNRIPEHVSL